MASGATIIGVVVLVIVIVAGAAYLFSTGSKGQYTTTTAGGSTVTTISGSGYNEVPIAMTDPPNVPNGTSALVITYSNVQVHTFGTNSSGWVNASGSGSVNLIEVVNSSQTVADANLAANTTINIVRFNITSAKITINGTTYNVSVPSNQVTVAITGSQKVNSSSAVLIDFYPTVNSHTSAQSNSTSSAVVYMMAPAGRAVILATNSTVSVSTSIGARNSLSASAKVQIGLNVSV